MLPAVGASAASEAVAGAGVPVACSVAGATDGPGSGAGFLERINLIHLYCGCVWWWCVGRGGGRGVIQEVDCHLFYTK